MNNMSFEISDDRKHGTPCRSTLEGHYSYSQPNSNPAPGININYSQHLVISLNINLVTASGARNKLREEDLL